MSRYRIPILVLFYVGLTAVLSLILSEQLANVVPDTAAKHIGDNSEGYLAALLGALWIQSARPRLLGSSAQWLVTAAVAVALLGLGVWLYNSDVSDMPSRFKALNEALLALGLVIPYVQLRRPLPKAVPVTVVAVLLAITIFGQSSQLMTDLAEMFAILVLVPVALDLVDSGILQRDAVTSTQTRYGWYAFLVVFAFLSSLVQHMDVGAGPLDDFTHYANRAREGLIGVLLLELYFAVGQGWVGRPAGSEQQRSAASAL